MKLPSSFKKYFWEVNLKDIDPLKHKNYIIERLLEYGDEKTFRWLIKNFGLQTVLKVGRKGKKVSSKTKNFLNLIFK